MSSSVQASRPPGLDSLLISFFSPRSHIPFIFFPLLFSSSQNTHSISTKINLKWCNAEEKSRTRPRLDSLLISFFPLPFDLGKHLKIHSGEKSNQTEIGFVVDLFPLLLLPSTYCLVSPLFLCHKIHIASQQTLFASCDC